MDLNYQDWYNGTYQNYNDPRYNTDTPEKENCVICNSEDDCGCEEEWSNKSNCCEAKMDTDLKICSKCKEHCQSAWEYDNNLINK